MYVSTQISVVIIIIITIIIIIIIIVVVVVVVVVAVVVIIIMIISSTSIYYYEWYSNVHLINYNIFKSSSYCDYGDRKVRQYLQATFKGFCLQH